MNRVVVLVEVASIRQILRQKLMRSNCIIGNIFLKLFSNRMRQKSFEPYDPPYSHTPYGNFEAYSEILTAITFSIGGVDVSP